MKNRILRVAAVATTLVILVTSLAACGKEKQYPELKEKTFVNDFAGVISEADKQEITNK